MMRFSLISALAGAVAALGFVPLGVWPLTLLGLAVMMDVLARATSRGQALGIGYAFGVGHFCVGNGWIAGAFRYAEDLSPAFGWVGVAGIALFLAIYPALATGLAWRLSGVAKRSPVLVLLLAGFWILTEWLRASLFTGYAWNPLGMVAVDGADIARFTGSYGLSGLVVLVAGGLWLMVRRQIKAGLLVAGVPLLVGTAASLLPAPLLPQSRPALLRVVQPNIAQKDKYRPDYESENFTKLATFSGNAGVERRMLFWPEAAVPDFLGEEDGEAQRARQRIAALLGPRDLVLLGADKLFKEVKQQGIVIEERWIGAANAVYFLNPEAQIKARYDKSHLVPFGEYLPLRALLKAMGLSRFVPGDLEFLPGPGPRTIDPGQGWPRVGVQICYEIIFSGEIVDPRPGQRPDFIFNPSNDAWYGSWQPPQHLAQARLRAVEEGLPIVRSTPTGISAIIDARGKVVKALPYEQAGAIEAQLPAAAATTLFARWGNLLAVGLGIMLILAGIALRRRNG